MPKTKKSGPTVIPKVDLSQRIADLTQVDEKTINWLAKQLGVKDPEKKELLAKFLNPNADRVGNMLDALTSITHQALKKDEAVYLEGIGTINAVTVGAKKGRNVRTGETIDIPPTRRPKLVVSATFKRAVV